MDGDGNLRAALVPWWSHSNIGLDARTAESPLLLVANALLQIVNQLFVFQAFDAQAFQLSHVFLEMGAVFLCNTVMGGRARIVGHLYQTKVKIFTCCLAMSKSETEEKQEEICWHGGGLEPAD